MNYHHYGIFVTIQTALLIIKAKTFELELKPFLSLISPFISSGSNSLWQKLHPPLYLCAQI